MGNFNDIHEEIIAGDIRALSRSIYLCGVNRVEPTDLMLATAEVSANRMIQAIAAYRAGAR